MKIYIPVAAPVSYNPAYFLADAFKYYGCDTEVIDQSQLYEKSAKDADFFFGVDSGGPLNIPDNLLHKSGMWFIDSRRNHNPEIRNPDDDITGRRILTGGGLVFQAQVEDAIRFCQEDDEYSWRTYYLPLAVDTEVWADTPTVEKPSWSAAFVGNCYDTQRLDALNKLISLGILHWPGIEGAIAGKGAIVYRNALCGLNIPSWWGTPECYDVNMRVFEICSCGRPLITNNVKGLYELGFEEGNHFISYSDFEEIPDIIHWFENNIQDAEIMGKNSHNFVKLNHTYIHRAAKILELIEELYVN